MKKLIVALIILSLLFMSGCRSTNIGIHTFRAEVLDFYPDFYLLRDKEMLFVYSITPVGAHTSGGRYFIRRNDSVIVLDVDGEPISYADISLGTIVDIKYYAIVLESDPAILPSAITIQVVE
ncbi:MAG: hypothetical protein FWC73_03115 [Defluviitaleaceae bacterium]|nr:hypothetical protein [Defluviitaleaceae bacterium]